MPAASETPLHGQQLIDRFIEQAEEAALPETSVPDVSVPVEAKEGVLVETAATIASESEEESYFTETLAKIYVKQQRYDKALEIIKKLNLKYPKKNAYFADQIRFLEKLIINAKSK